MKPLPHRYTARAVGAGADTLELQSGSAPPLQSASPLEFGGPGGLWSPETLLVGAVADCFVLTFRAVARAGRLEWQRLECETEGTLERIDGVTAFTRFASRATLTVPPGTDAAKAQDLLERSERSCLIANSLKAGRTLQVTIVEATT